MLSGRVHNNRERLLPVFRSSASMTRYRGLGGNSLRQGTCARRTRDHLATQGPMTASRDRLGCGSYTAFQHMRTQGGRSSGALLRTLVRLSSGPPGSLCQVIRRTGSAVVDPKERRALSVAVCCNPNCLTLVRVGLLSAQSVIRHRATPPQSWDDAPGSSATAQRA